MFLRIVTGFPAQVILRWHVQQGHIVIPGSKTPSHIAQNLDLFDFALTDQEMAQIATLNRGKPMFEHTEERLAQFTAFVPMSTARRKKNTSSASTSKVTGPGALTRALPGPRAAWCPWPELMEQDSTGAWHLREHPERLPLQFAITAHKN